MISDIKRAVVRAAILEVNQLQLPGGRVLRIYRFSQHVSVYASTDAPEALKEALEQALQEATKEVVEVV